MTVDVSTVDAPLLEEFVPVEVMPLVLVVNDVLDCCFFSAATSALRFSLEDSSINPKRSVVPIGSLSLGATRLKRSAAWTAPLSERHATITLRVVQDVFEAPISRRPAEHRRCQFNPGVRTGTSLSFAAEHARRVAFGNHQLGKRIGPERQQRDHDQNDEQHTASSGR